MKTIIKKSFKEVLADRYVFSLSVFLLILTIIFIIIISLSIEPSERQLISHYSSFGVTHFYSNRWFYLFSFVLFGFSSSIMHIIISIKLLQTKGRPFALIALWLGVAVLLVAWIIVSSLLGLRAKL